MAAKFNILSVGGKGKGLGIFNSDRYKDNERLRFKRMFWRFRWLFWMWLAGIIGFGLAFATEHVWRYGWNPATVTWLSVYFDQILHTGGLRIFAEIPAWLLRAFLRPDLPVMVPLFPIIAYNLVTIPKFLEEFNPHGDDIWTAGASRKADADDVAKMGRYGGLFKGFMVVLGKFKKKYLMLDETLSVLCVAPPGIGKTTGVVQPTIYKCDTVSMIVNDPKPELDELTSGYRATLGPVFIMNWAGQDDPANGVYFPSWNPLSPEHVPFLQEDRDLYIDSICQTLIPERSSSADPHWSLTGRAALTGFLQFIVAKIERAKWNDYFKARLESGTFDQTDRVLLDERYALMRDPNAEAARHLLATGALSTLNYVPVGTWSNIPPAWLGREASLSMTLDWLTTSQIRIAEELDNRRKQGDQMVMMADPMRDLFQDAVEEARQYGYANRAIQELTQLANTPDKERGSIMSTALSGLNIFRNAAVRNRTSHSDFHFSDLRGMKNSKTGKWEPVTVYLSINMVNAEAVNPITAIFIELMSSFLLTNKPEEIHAGQKLGDKAVLFVLDEMPKMQKMDAVIKGPDMGRGQKVSYLIIGQDLAQIREKYGADALETIMSTTAAKIVFRQNNYETAERFSRIMGNKQKIEEETDDKTGKVKDNKKDSEPLYSIMDIMKLDSDKQLVLMQGWPNRPIECDVPYFFKDPELTNLSKIPRASALPEFLIPAHHAIMGYPGVPRIYDHKTKTVREIKT
jgi:type IV secretion system protein VirD4